MEDKKNKEGTKKDYNSHLIRDFEAVRNQLRYMALRGYRTRTEYINICVGEEKYDATKTKIHFLLQKTPKALQGYMRDGKAGYRFCNQPMVWQDNPLAEVWRYRIPDQNIFLYLVVLQLLEERPKTLEDIVEGIKWIAKNDERPLEESIQALAACQDSRAEEPDEAENPNKALVKRMRSVLKKMVEAGLIRGEGGRGKRKRYYLEKNVWAKFERKELEEIHDYLEFLKNVSPFELPYYLLQKNLELWAELDKKPLQKRAIFLFRHRNLVNVVDSEIWYAILKVAKSKQPIPIRIKADYAEFHTPKDINEETGGPSVYEYNTELTPGKLEYNCLTGQIHQVDGEGSHFYPIGIVDVPTGALFHVAHSVYFEQMVRLLNELNKKGERKLSFAELKEQFWSGLEWDSKISQRLFPEEPEDYSFFEYKKASQKYVLKKNVERVPFFITRVQKEALKSLAEMPESMKFTSLFLSDETIAKIKAVTNDFESTWDMKDIELINQNPKYSRVISRQELRYVMEHIKRKRYIVDKEGKRYIPLRIQYSLYYNEFRILVGDEKEKNIKCFLLMRLT